MCEINKNHRQELDAQANRANDTYQKSLYSIGGLLEQAGGNKQNITRLVAYISEQAFGDYDEVLGAIEHYFSGSPPSVTAVAVQNLSDPNQNIMMNAVADLGTA